VREERRDRARSRRWSEDKEEGSGSIMEDGGGGAGGG